MKEVAIFLTAVADGLKAMSKAVNGMAMQLEQMNTQRDTGTTSVATRPIKNKTKRNNNKKTASDIVYEHIKSNRNKTISANTLVTKTGFNKKKIHNSIFRLKQQGKIKSIAKGVYTIK